MGENGDFWKNVGFSKTVGIFGKMWDFRKNVEFSKKIGIFGKMWDFQKNMGMSIFQKEKNVGFSLYPFR